MRRNQALVLTRPEGSSEKTVAPLAGLTVIGVVCNPRTHEPLLVVTDGTYVSLRSLKQVDLGRRLGRGYYEDRSNNPSNITGLPRSHTPDGVAIKGKGYGTALYSALALGAHLALEHWVKIDMYEEGDGICSWTDDRSSEADTWWSQAVKKGLAEQKVEEDTEREEGVDLHVKPSDLDEFVDEGEVVYVNTVNVDIEKTTSSSVEVLEYESVFDRVHIVAAAMSIDVPDNEKSVSGAIDFVWRAVQEDHDNCEAVDPAALLALDVRGLARPAVGLLSVLYGAADLGDAARDELEMRFRQGLDPVGNQGAQLRLIPNHGGLSDVSFARKEARWEEVEDLP